MNEKIRFIFPLFIMVLLSACSNNSPGANCTPPNSKSLTMTLKPQEKSMWCWAASGEMIMEYLGATIRQCDEANKQFNPERDDCCNSPFPTDCNRGGWPEFEEYGFAADQTDMEALTWAEIKKQIGCLRTPFCATWKRSSSLEGHMVVISGYKTTSGIKYVRMRNPLPVGTGSSRWIRYTYYVAHTPYVHWNDYYNIKGN